MFIFFFRYLAKTGQTAVAEELIKVGAEVDVVAEDDTTALYHAAREGNLAFAIMLVKNGANVNRYHKHTLGSTHEFRKALFGK